MASMTWTLEDVLTAPQRLATEELDFEEHARLEEIADLASELIAVAAHHASKFAQPQVINKKQLRGSVASSVYIGRPSIWGNPFVIGRDGIRDDVVAKYERWIVQQGHLMARLGELRGKFLVCWCVPEHCHGHVLAKLASDAIDRLQPDR